MARRPVRRYCSPCRSCCSFARFDKISSIFPTIKLFPERHALAVAALTLHSVAYMPLGACDHLVFRAVIRLNCGKSSLVQIYNPRYDAWVDEIIVVPPPSIIRFLSITPMRRARHRSILPSKCHVLPSDAIHRTRRCAVSWSRKAACPRRRLLTRATRRDTLPITMCRSGGAAAQCTCVVALMTPPHRRKRFSFGSLALERMSRWAVCRSTFGNLDSCDNGKRTVWAMHSA